MRARATALARRAWGWALRLWRGWEIRVVEGRRVVVNLRGDLTARRCSVLTAAAARARAKAAQRKPQRGDASGAILTDRPIDWFSPGTVGAERRLEAMFSTACELVYFWAARVSPGELDYGKWVGAMRHNVGKLLWLIRLEDAYPRRFRTCSPAQAIEEDRRSLASRLERIASADGVGLESLEEVVRQLAAEMNHA